MIKKLLELFKESPLTGSEASLEVDAALAATSLLFELAKVDLEVSASELDHIRSTAQELFNLSDTAVQDFLNTSQENAQSSTSLYEFTQTLNKAWDDHQKYVLILSMWRLALADDIICKFEEHMIRRIADLLYIPHPQFIKAKHEAKDLHG